MCGGVVGKELSSTQQEQWTCHQTSPFGSWAVGCWGRAASWCAVIVFVPVCWWVLLSACLGVTVCGSACVLFPHNSRESVDMCSSGPKPQAPGACMARTVSQIPHISRLTAFHAHAWGWLCFCCAAGMCWRPVVFLIVTAHSHARGCLDFPVWLGHTNMKLEAMCTRLFIIIAANVKIYRVTALAHMPVPFIRRPRDRQRRQRQRRHRLHLEGHRLTDSWKNASA